MESIHIVIEPTKPGGDDGLSQGADGGWVERMTKPLPPNRISESRVRRWDAYCATLTEEEQQDLDRLIEAICDAVHARGKGFGVRCAKELVMAIFEFQSQK